MRGSSITILFLAPTIALVSQARREWLTHATRRLSSLVVCADPWAGGRNEQEDIRISELECPVESKPEEIAAKLRAARHAPVVFCTYQSLMRVVEAQKEHAAPPFALTIADEAHRTTGVLNRKREKVDFQLVHASASALRRNQALRDLSEAGKDGTLRVVCNVKLFTEGVDVPSLNAVAFLDPRDSQVDVVQAVGRVMRRADDKRFGYIVVSGSRRRADPAIIQPGSGRPALRNRSCRAAKPRRLPGVRT